jgi:iron-sulfur cluster insertion protein
LLLKTAIVTRGDQLAFYFGLSVNLDLPSIWGHTNRHQKQSATGNQMSEQSNAETSAPAAIQANAGVFGLSLSAAERITHMLSGEPDGSFFRVAVLGGGCSGFQYDFSIDQKRNDDDIVFTAHGVDVVVDDMSIELIDHAELDYVQDLMGSYFAVTNPNATASCGCGTSFSV